MANQEIVRYIRNQLSAKFSKNEIVASLKAVGWNEQDVSEAFSIIERSIETNTSLTATTAFHKEYIALGVIAACFFTLNIITIQGFLYDYSRSHDYSLGFWFIDPDLSSTLMLIIPYFFLIGVFATWTNGAMHRRRWLALSYVVPSFLFSLIMFVLAALSNLG